MDTELTNEPICPHRELLEEDYKTNYRYERDLNEAWNTGDGVYIP